MKSLPHIISIIFYIILICLPAIYGQTEEKLYQVIKIKGNIQNLSQGVPLLPKQHFSSEDKLKFSSEEDRIAVIDEAKRTFIGVPESWLSAYELKPIRAKFGTRPGEISTYIAFVKYLDGRDFLILGEEVRLDIQAPNLQMDEQHFFYIRYELEGNIEPINKKLAFEGKQIIIAKSNLFEVDGKYVESANASNFVLFYYNTEQTESLKINDLNLVFPDEQAIKEEISIIQSSFGNSPKERSILKESIENYLMEVYGIPEEENLRMWMKEVYGF